MADAVLVCVSQIGLYIAISIHSGNRQTVLRRFPRPNELRGRSVKYREAREYAERVRAVLRCALEMEGFGL